MSLIHVGLLLNTGQADCVTTHARRHDAILPQYDKCACHIRAAPSFHHSVAVLPLPLRRAVVPLSFFRSVAADENGNAGNVFSVYIGMKRPERWLAVRLRQNGKIGFDSIVTERRLRHNGRWQRQRRNGFFFHV